MDISENKSEIARLRWQIERTCEAMQRVMNDPGFSASHESIRRRYEHLGRQEQELAQHVGEEQAHDITYDIYNEVMKREDGAMQNEHITGIDTSNDEPGQEAVGQPARGTQEVQVSMEGGEPQLLIITLPEFRRGYEAGKQAVLSGEAQDTFLIDRDVIELLKDFVAEGLFADADEAPLHWHIGQLLGLMCGSAFRWGTRLQPMIIQAKDNLVLTIALTPL